MSNEFLEEIQSVHHSLRAPLIKFISAHVKDCDDLREITKFLHVELQQNLYLLDYLCDKAVHEEKLTPYEVKELILYLIPLDNVHREIVLQDGLLPALDNRKLSQLKRVSSALEMNKEEEKVKGLDKTICKEAFE